MGYKRKFLEWIFLFPEKIEAVKAFKETVETEERAFLKTLTSSVELHFHALCFMAINWFDSSPDVSDQLGHWEKKSVPAEYFFVWCALFAPIVCIPHFSEVIFFLPQTKQFSNGLRTG